MDFLILKKIPLFYGVKPEEIPSILHCLSGQIRSFSKGEMIFCAGESITSVGIVLEGSVHVEIDDFWGSKNILNHVGPGQLFGEAYACSPSEPLMVNVVSVTPSQILFLDVPKILHTCEKPCSHHQQMIENLLRIMATSNLQLPAGSCTPHRKPSVNGCSPIFPIRNCSPDRLRSPSPSTASSSLTISAWTGVRFRKKLGKCRRTGCWK